MPHLAGQRTGRLHTTATGTSRQGNTPAEESGGRSSLLSLLNGVRVLNSFTVAEPVLGVNEIARRVDPHKSTVSRTLATLELVGLAERDEPSGRFRLGVGVIGLAGPLPAHLDLRRIAYRGLEDPVRLTGETGALAHPMGTGRTG